MTRSPLLPLAAVAMTLVLAGCDDHVTSPADRTPPAAPRGLRSVTGDGQVVLSWLANTEADVAGYRIYQSPCATGPGCPFDRVGATTATEFVVSDLANGVTRFYAVSAVDDAGNESRLSHEDVFDTPRPEGFGRALDNFVDAPSTSAWDFSARTVRPADHPSADIVFGASGSTLVVFTTFTDVDIQDAGYAASLDAIDYAPAEGWSPTGSAEAIAGHCYVVRTRDHYAKFRITSVTPARMVFDWAYQTDPGNRELRARKARGDAPRTRRAIRWSS